MTVFNNAWQESGLVEQFVDTLSITCWRIMAQMMM